MTDPRVLIVDDNRQAALALQKNLRMEGYQADVAASADEATEFLEHHDFAAVVADLRMPGKSGIELCEEVKRRRPDTEVVILTAYGTINSAVEAVKKGATDYLTKPVDFDRLSALLRRVFELRRLRAENRALRQQIEADRKRQTLIGVSPAMARVMETVRTVAPSDATVLIRGESGTGKELVATAIHQLSPRAERPLVKVNCAAIPESLLEDELFGHERGAFTGAHAQRKGRFELAHGGTIFLDEIAEMSPALQAKLLRALQEREFERVGGSETILVDVRVVASTNRDIEKEVRQGNFREDLYYRINVVPIHLPPLRERREDIPVLADHFLKLYAAKNRKPIEALSRRALEKLMAYQWPGNVRELENCIERACVLAQRQVLEADDLLLNPQLSGASHDFVAAQLIGEGFSLEDFERRLIEASLRRTGGNQSRAAKLLGLSRRTLQYRIEKYAIRIDKDSPQ